MHDDAIDPFDGVWHCFTVSCSSVGRLELHNQPVFMARTVLSALLLGLCVCQGFCRGTLCRHLALRGSTGYCQALTTLLAPAVPDHFPLQSAASNDACGMCKLGVRVLGDLMCDPSVEDTVVSYQQQAASHPTRAVPACPSQQPQLHSWLPIVACVYYSFTVALQATWLMQNICSQFNKDQKQQVGHYCICYCNCYHRSHSMGSNHQALHGMI